MLVTQEAWSNVATLPSMRKSIAWQLVPSPSQTPHTSVVPSHWHVYDVSSQVAPLPQSLPVTHSLSVWQLAPV